MESKASQMIKSAEQIVERVKQTITCEINANDAKTIALMLGAYNRYQYYEHEGADYIFSIYNQDDLKKMVDNGLTAAEIVQAWNKVHYENFLPYFHFGDKYFGISAIGNLNDLKRKLISWLNEILLSVISRPLKHDEYKDLYEHYFKEQFEKGLEN